MHRVVLGRYGGPEVLELVSLPDPVPAAHEVVVALAASSVNPIDLKSRNGAGAARALGEPPVGVGWDIAGVVEARGSAVADLAVGQRVFGMPRFPREVGSYATHVCVPAGHLAPAPDGVTDEILGAVPLAGLTALSAVRDLAGVATGHRVLVHGAAGGVGHLAVQIACLLGADVAATARAEHADFIRGFGASQVVDSRECDIVASLGANSFDAVIDLVGHGDVPRSVALTRTAGVVVCVPGGADSGLDEAALAAGIRTARTGVAPNRAGLMQLGAWLAEGKLSVEIGASFDLTQVAEAHRRLEAGGARGKIGIRTVAGA